MVQGQVVSIINYIVNMKKLANRNDYGEVAKGSSSITQSVDSGSHGSEDTQPL